MKLTDIACPKSGRLIPCLQTTREQFTMNQPDYTLLDRPDISEAMFYPRWDWDPPDRNASDHSIHVGDQVDLVCRFYAIDKSAPSILYFHGNGEVVSDYDDLGPIYNRFGINLFVVDYRGYGASTGRPSFSTMIADSHTILDFFREFLNSQGYRDCLFVMGRSMGASSALELAAHYPTKIRAVILESGAGMGNWSRWIRPFEDTTSWGRLQISHMEKLRSIVIPLLTIHGELDDLIPVERALELREVISSDKKELLIIPRAGHNDIFVVGMRIYMESLSSFIKTRASS